MDRDTTTAVLDHRHQSHLRFRSWKEQIEHQIGSDSRMLWGMIDDEFTGEYENVVTSVLSDPDSTDPPVSPAFQEMRQRWRGNVCEFMTMGQFGPHRYSGVMTARSLPKGMDLYFDLADRRSDVETPLVCTYAVNRLAILDREIAPGRLRWSLTPRESQVRLLLEAEPPARLEVSRSDRPGCVVRVIAGGAPGSADQRCRYRWRWSAPPLEDSSSTPTRN